MTFLSHIRSIGKGMVGGRRGPYFDTVADKAEIWGRAVGTADGRASTQMLTACRDRFRGDRAVIIGNGPSLRNTDLALLERETTFGLNRVYLLFDELGFHTSFLVAINELLISQVSDEIVAVRGQKFLRWSSRRVVHERSPSITFLHPRRTPGFARDARRGVWEGATVTYVAMQLAYHMGFSKVVLVGVDHNFSTQGPPNQTVESSGADPDHFHPNYFGQGFRWQLPDLARSEYAYGLARRAYEEDGRIIVDATVGGKLEVFTKLDLAAALAN